MLKVTLGIHLHTLLLYIIRHSKCSGYQRGNQKPKIEKGQTIQWLRKKGQKENHRSTKHYTVS
jgi:hypothetical protein